MKNKITNTVLITGIVITLICLFLPVGSTCKILPGIYDFVDVDIYGYASLVNYLSLFFLTYITISSFNRKSLAAKISMVVFTIVGFAITQFMFEVGRIGVSNPCGYSREKYQILLDLGYVLILLSAYIRMFTVKASSQKHDNDLLDELED